MSGGGYIMIQFVYFFMLIFLRTLNIFDQFWTSAHRHEKTLKRGEKVKMADYEYVFETKTTLRAV